MLPSGHRQKIREAVIITAAFLTALFLLRQSAKAPEYLSPVDRGILLLVTPLQSRMARLARSIGHAAGQYVDLVHVRAENETLRNDNNRLRAELLEAKRGAAESVRFQRLLGLRNAVTAETLVARVIAIDVSPYFRVARIQLDRGEGLVSRGMPIITPDGVVGRINRVAVIPRTSCFRWIPVPPSTWCCRGLAVAAFCAASPARMATAAPSNTSCRASKPKKAIWS